MVRVSLSGQRGEGSTAQKLIQALCPVGVSVTDGSNTPDTLTAGSEMSVPVCWAQAGYPADKMMTHQSNPFITRISYGAIQGPAAMRRL